MRFIFANRGNGHAGVIVSSTLPPDGMNGDLKMNLKIVLAGAASALLVGTFAVAQTTGATSGTTSTGASGSTATDTTSGSMNSGSMSGQSTTGATGATAGASSADQYSADTAAQTGDTAMAGERG